MECRYRKRMKLHHVTNVHPSLHPYPHLSIIHPGYCFQSQVVFLEWDCCSEMSLRRLYMLTVNTHPEKENNLTRQLTSFILCKTAL